VSALLPCPFCGAAAEIERHIGGDGDIRVHVGCSASLDACGVSPRIDYTEEWEAVKHWNRRVEEKP
jgi:sarcosine oxidase delta subunit